MQGSLCYKCEKEVGRGGGGELGLIDTKGTWILSPPFPFVFKMDFICKMTEMWV